jgi:hypothetical protein
MAIFSIAVHSQTTLKIEFSGNQKQVKETKKILNKYDIYLIFSDNKEIKYTYTKDSLLIIENKSDEQLERIKSQEFPLVKLENKRHCFYFLLSTNLSTSNTIKDLIIYRIPIKKKRVLGFFAVTKKTKELASELNYTVRGLSVSQPIIMIPCSEYNGENDKVLERYRKLN